MDDVGEANSVMLLYKYRALEPFEYIADIVDKGRFHTAAFFDLNDPMEGLFALGPGVKAEYWRKIREAKEKVRICSFSRTYRCPVLWAHYAGGFRGICIEIAVKRLGRYLCQDSTTDYDAAETQFDEVSWATVRYSSIRNIIQPERAKNTVLSPQTLLIQKGEDWGPEEEIRAFASDKFIYCKGRMNITRILLGIKTPRVMQRVLTRIVPSKVSVWTTRIGAMNQIEIDEKI